MFEDTTAIATLKVRSRGTDRIALQHGINRQLRGSELTPEGLPPSAVLIVRRMRDPMPGHLASGTDRVHPPYRWVEAVRNSLRDLLSNAAHPDSSGLSKTAPAVLFADQSELTACLVLDLVRGQAGARWWWRRIGVAMPDLSFAATNAGASAIDPYRVILARARELPAVFAHLARWRASVEVAASFDHSQTRDLLQAVAIEHHVDPLVIAPHSRKDREPDTAPATTHPTSVQASDKLLAATTATSLSSPHSLPAAHTNRDPHETAEEYDRIEEPWLSWLPPDAAHRPLSPGQRCLLGLALALHAAPMLVRQRGFAHRAQAWWRQQERIGRLSWEEDYAYPLAGEAQDSGPDIAIDPTVSSQNALNPDAPNVTSDLPPSSYNDPYGVGVTQAETPPSRLSDETGVPESKPPERPRHDRPPSTDISSADVIDNEPAPTGSDDSDCTRNPPAPLREQPDELPAEPPRPQNEPAPTGSDDSDCTSNPPAPLRGQPDELPAEPPRPQSVTFTGEQFCTHLGGVLYLIHALEELGIPMAFEEEWKLASRLGPWGALDLVARTLLQDRFADVADDAIWTVLTGMAGNGVPELPANSTSATVDNRKSRRSGQQPDWSETTPNYRAPPHWRTALAENTAALRWTAADGRLWLWSSNGYLIASVRRDAQPPVQQARAETTAWLGDTPVDLSHGRLDQAPLTRFADQQCGEDLCAWATAAAPAIARRLRLALDREPDDLESLWRLLSVEAQLYVTGSHIDLVADINEIWLPARRAGLDRNPGWLADYGRVVLFHFR